jgi:ferritin-like metal-binding protein YciE
VSALFHRIANHQVTANVLDLQQEDATMAKREPNKLENLFHDTLKDIYFAEKKILATLPKMEKAARSAELKSAFAKHRKETEGHVARLDKRPQGKTCDAIIGITDEGAEIMKEYKGSPALDAGLLAAAQAGEHYEISRYGTLKTWASELGLNDAVPLDILRCGSDVRFTPENGLWQSSPECLPRAKPDAARLDADVCTYAANLAAGAIRQCHWRGSICRTIRRGGSPQAGAVTSTCA